MKKVKKWILILAGIYLLALVFLYFGQDKLTFFPHKTLDEDWTKVIESIGGDYVSIRAYDREVLEGIFLSDHSEKPRPTVLFFEGNAMRVEEFAHDFTRLRDNGINVLLMDYRGYGLSTGKPNTDDFKKDAEKIFDAMLKHPHIDNNNISVWGYSIGSGVATHLASVRPISKVILSVPFTSTVDLAKRMFPIFPISKLLKHRLDNLALAPSLMQPALIMAGEKDMKIPSKQAQKVADNWGGNVKFYLGPGKGHNEMLEGEVVWEKVVEFLKLE
jgi:uncharacterized protein